MDVKVTYPLKEVGELIDVIYKVVDSCPVKRPASVFRRFLKEARVPEDKVVQNVIATSDGVEIYEKTVILKYGGAAIQLSLVFDGAFGLYMGPNIDIYNQYDEFLYIYKFPRVQLV